MSGVALLSASTPLPDRRIALHDRRDRHGPHALRSLSGYAAGLARTQAAKPSRPLARTAQSPRLTG